MDKGNLVLLKIQGISGITGIMSDEAVSDAINSILKLTKIEGFSDQEVNDNYTKCLEILMNLPSEVDEDIFPQINNIINGHNV